MSIAKRIKDLEDIMPKIVIKEQINTLSKASMTATVNLDIASRVENPIHYGDGNIQILKLDTITRLRSRVTCNLPLTVGPNSNFNATTSNWEFTASCSSNELIAGDLISFNLSAPNAKSVSATTQVRR